MNRLAHYIGEALYIFFAALIGIGSCFFLVAQLLIWVGVLK